MRIRKFSIFQLSIPLLCLPVSVPITTLVVTMVTWYKVHYCETSSIALFAQDCFPYSVHFHTDIGIVFSISVSNTIGILMETALSLCIIFCNAVIFSILILPSHEQVIFPFSAAFNFLSPMPYVFIAEFLNYFD